MSGLVEAFIIIAGIAIVIQMAILLAMFVQMRSAIENFTSIASVMGDASEITRLARGQAQKVDRVFTEAVERLRIQVIRADQILTGAIEVIEEAGSRVRRTVWGPFQQASAVLKGLKVGLDLIRGQQRRPQSDAATQDEELFI